MTNTSTQSEELFARILDLRIKSNELANHLKPEFTPLFGEITVPVPSKALPDSEHEPVFVRILSWLYVFYFETGTVDQRYLLDLLSAYNISSDEHKLHIGTVKIIRTRLHHNLDSSSSEDQKKVALCDGWFQSKCGCQFPKTIVDWQRCSAALATDAWAYFDALHRCLLEIQRDSFRELVLDQWMQTRLRHHQPHEWDEIVRLVAGDFGREWLDAPKFRKSRHGAWDKELQMLTIGFDFKHEARRIVERDLLSDEKTSCPVMAPDAMRALNLGPGPQVEAALREARRLYIQEPCSKSELLNRLIQWYQQ